MRKVILENNMKMIGVKNFKCIFRLNCALVPNQRINVPE